MTRATLDGPGNGHTIASAMLQPRPVGCAVTLALGVAGMITGLAWAIAIERGYFTDWELLPALPVPAEDVRIDGIDHGSFLSPRVVFRATNGSHYAIEGATRPWRQTSPGTPLPRTEWSTPSRTVIHPCDQSQPEFSITAHPPSDMVACVQLAWRFEGTHRETYAVTAEGEVWRWQRIARGMFLPVSYLVAPLTGLVVGAGLGLVLQRRAGRRGQVLGVAGPSL